jgi:hypothetical protein
MELGTMAREIPRGRAQAEETRAEHRPPAAARKSRAEREGKCGERELDNVRRLQVLELCHSLTQSLLNPNGPAKGGPSSPLSLHTGPTSRPAGLIGRLIVTNRD